MYSGFHILRTPSNGFQDFQELLCTDPNIATRQSIMYMYIYIYIYMCIYIYTHMCILGCHTEVAGMHRRLMLVTGAILDFWHHC